ncbi:MAG: type IV secretion system DNA-binding domain-containing protein [Patescibacteria group bacterium]|nr:type IV secretion system DNA-binding domain-containing protein [Patescibacteria group bacterium]
MSFVIFFLAIILGAAIGFAVYFLIQRLTRQKIINSLKTALFLVKIPRPTPQDQPGNSENKDFKAELAHFEQLLGSFTALKKPFAFEVAVPHVGEEIHFYLAVPKLAAEIAVKQIQGLWNGASVELVMDDYNIFNVNGAAAAAYLMEKEIFAVPMRTYAELGIDSFESILGAFSKINEVGEGAAMQVIMRPAEKGVKKAIEKYIDLLKRGEPAKKVFGNGFPMELADVGAVFNPKSKEEQEKEKRERPVDEELVKALQAKLAKPLFSVNVRFVASASSEFQANDILDGLTAGFSQFAAPERNGFRIVKPGNMKNIVSDFIFRHFEPSHAMTLSVEEVASFCHFPISSTETPKVKWLKSKEAPPPENLPKGGLLLGESDFRGQRKPIYMGDEDRRRHLYLVGQTGTGKSTLIGNLVKEDIQSGKGLAIIDPHGDLVENALGFVPKERMDDVIYFNPGDLARPMGLNMLDYNFNRPEEKTFIINEMINIFDKLYDLKTTGGPMFEQYMRNALLLMMEDMPNEPTTLVEVPRIFSDPVWRNKKLERIHNPVVIDFWQKEAAKAGGDASLANMTPYITSKFNTFISNDYMRPIVGQPKSAFNFREAMDSGKILLINLSKGRIGDLNASLLGLIFTGKILMAALSRVEIADSVQRRDFYLYIDEFQNFATDSISTILSEARKYRLDLIVAHQFIAQLAEKIRDAVFGNVGSILAFRVGVQDAEFLEKQFAPTFNKNDLINIDNLNAYARLLVNGETSRPFNLKVGTESWDGGNKELAEKLKEYSRLKYGMDRQTVEEGIYRRLRE